jgi:Phage tail assembly chaperone protein, TAC
VFSANATRLSGMVCAVLGWRPDDFWASTPAELASVLEALSPATEASGDANLLTRLKELFPDGSGN